MSGGAGKLGWLLVAFLAVPVLMGTCSTALFCRAVSPKVSAPPEREREPQCPAGSACGAAVEVLERAGRAESDPLRAQLTEPSWFDRLPPAATENAQEKGQYYLRQLLGSPPASLEELRTRPLEWRVTGSQTALDGQTATVQVEYRNVPGQAELGVATLTLRREQGTWKIVPPAAPAR